MPRGRNNVPAMTESRLHLRDLLQVLIAHWKVVVGVTLAVVLGVYFTGRNAIPRYQAKATVQVNSKKQVFSRLDDTGVEEMALKTDPVLSEALVLTTQNLGLTVSDAVGLRIQFADPLIRRNDLIYGVQVDSLALPDSFDLRVNGARGWELRDRRGRALTAGSYETPVAGPGFTFMVHADEGQPWTARFAVLARVTAASMVRGGIGYAIQPSTNVVDVTYSGTDPSVVPDVLNQALRALANYGADRIREIANSRLVYINERVEDARQRYLQSLGSVQRYKEQQQTTDLSAEEAALINRIQDADRERTRRELDLATIRGIMGSSQEVTLETLNRLAAIAAIASNPAMNFQLENLLKLYDERRTRLAGVSGLRETNPEVAAIDQRIGQSSRALVDATQATIRSLQSTLASVETDIRTLRERLSTYPGKQSQFAQLALETELQNDTYKYLLSQLEAARITAATISPYVQIIEPATGAGRIGMGLRQKVMIGLIIGLFVAILMAFFLEYLDQTIKTSADVERALEVPVLGLIPLEPITVSTGAAPGNGHARRRMNLPLVSLLSPDHPASEAYRTLRTNVTFVNAEQRELQALVITSPGPGEGKSTTAANLAITLAQQGSRTLLVDADLRRPLVHRAFNLVQEPGLTDILVGSATLREAIRPNVVPKLDVLPAGALPPNPSELLGSEAMSRLLESLRGQYDTIIFDTPPTLAVTDATVLGASVDAVILVVRAGETDEVAAQRALQQLRRVQAKIAGTVLNGMQKRRDRYYNYYSYYRSDWNPGKGVMSALKSRISNLL